MPKLSQYLRDRGSEAPQSSGRPAAASHSAGQRTQPAGAAQSGANEVHTQRSPQATQAPVPVPPDKFAAASKKLQDAFAKRLREHGPRRFRWPDGSLREERPPPSPYAVSNRVKWAPIVHYSRTHGGDRAFEATGQSLRYGIAVPWDQHVSYLQHAQLEPEAEDTAGGKDSPELDPLEDPEHPFKSFYREGAAAVLTRDHGRLL